MFIIYRRDETIFVPDNSFIALRYSRSESKVIIRYRNSTETLNNIDGVNYVNTAQPTSLKFKREKSC